jgi:hypothetical protein
VKENCTQRFKTRERSITLVHATTPKQMPTTLKALEKKCLSIFERHLVSVNIPPRKPEATYTYYFGVGGILPLLA